MNRPRIVREVYGELRHTLGGLVCPREILESAAALVELFTRPEETGPLHELRTGRLPFEQWELDIAFADGGWRVMGYETHLEEDLMQEAAAAQWHGPDGDGDAAMSKLKYGMTLAAREHLATGQPMASRGPAQGPQVVGGGPGGPTFFDQCRLHYYGAITAQYAPLECTT